VTAYDEVDFYSDMSILDDPFSYFAHLRRQGPVVELPHHGVMAVTTYDAAAQVLRDHARFSSCNSLGGPFPDWSEEPPPTDDFDEFLAAHRHEMPMAEYLITMDPPAHQSQRGLVMRLLTPKRMKENEEFMWRLADRQIDEFIGAGKVEVLRGYGQPFSLLVIADLLGVPEEDHREFRRQLGGLPQLEGDGGVGPVVHDPLAFLQERFAEYVEERRREPRDDVLTGLATATYPDGSIPDVNSVCRMATFLFAAGQDTTAKLITSALRIIAEEREVQAYLREDHARIPNFVEEVLRLQGVVKHAGRTARVTTEVAGVEIPAGTRVAVFPGAANRDPARFEAPDELRPDRPNANDHLAFGRGVHACPGGPLARVEAKVSIERFLDRTSDIAIDEEQHGPPAARRWDYEPIFVLFGLRALHLVVTTS
jgi:cytochrome P450